MTEDDSRMSQNEGERQGARGIISRQILFLHSLSLDTKKVLVFNKNISANETSNKVMVRSCVLDSGSLTDETEIIRQSMCGQFLFEGR